MIRAYILIQTFNGTRFKYVRDVTEGDTVGDTYAVQYAPYYTYGDSAGDTYGLQGDSSQVKHNYEFLVSNYTGDSLTNRFLLFPESEGDTYTLIRPNYDQLVDYEGDSTDIDIDPYIRTNIAVSAIQSMVVIEERIPREHRLNNVFIP